MNFKTIKEALAQPKTQFSFGDYAMHGNGNTLFAALYTAHKLNVTTSLSQNTVA